MSLLSKQLAPSHQQSIQNLKSRALSLSGRLHVKEDLESTHRTEWLCQK